MLAVAFVTLTSHYNLAKVFKKLNAMHAAPGVFLVWGCSLHFSYLMNNDASYYDVFCAKLMPTIDILAVVANHRHPCDFKFPFLHEGFIKAGRHQGLENGCKIAFKSAVHLLLGDIEKRKYCRSWKQLMCMGNF